MGDITRILVVEDEVLLLLDLVDNLADLGFESLPLTTADGAAAAVLNSRIDALITDIDLPGKMTGIDLAWRCAQLRPDMPIVVASAGVRLHEAVLPPGAVFVSKPYSMDQLMAGLMRGSLKHAA